MLEPRFNSDTLAMLLNISCQKTLLRRHLNTNFNKLVGAQAQQEKREYVEAAGYSPLNITAKVKVRKHKNAPLRYTEVAERSNTEPRTQLACLFLYVWRKHPNLCWGLGVSAHFNLWALLCRLSCACRTPLLFLAALRLCRRCSLGFKSLIALLKKYWKIIQPKAQFTLLAEPGSPSNTWILQFLSSVCSHIIEASVSWYAG